MISLIFTPPHSTPRVMWCQFTAYTSLRSQLSAPSLRYSTPPHPPNEHDEAATRPGSSRALSHSLTHSWQLSAIYPFGPSRLCPEAHVGLIEASQQRRQDRQDQSGWCSRTQLVCACCVGPEQGRAGQGRLSGAWLRWGYISVADLERRLNGLGAWGMDSKLGAWGG